MLRGVGYGLGLLGLLVADRAMATDAQAAIGRWVEITPAADSQWALCPPYTWYLIEPNEAVPTEPGVVYATADYSDSDQERVIFDGDATLRMDNRFLRADQLLYLRDSETVYAIGNVHYQLGGVHLGGESAMLTLPQESGEILQATYHEQELHLFADAERIVLHHSEHQSLEQSTYSTCPPANRAWSIHAASIDLNHESRQGIVRNATLRIHNTPVFWTPYLRFPLGEERLSGFLAPSLRSSGSDFDLALPYYWNIAPHRDATTTPHLYSRRGLMLRTEFRYLNRRSNGKLEYDLLPADRLHRSDRQRIHWRHRAGLFDHWQLSTEYNRVADVDHLVDFGAGSISDSRAQPPYLVRHIHLRGAYDNWLVQGRMEEFQRLRNDVPYHRLPQIELRSRYGEQPDRLNLSLDSEITRFSHERLAQGGDRLDNRLSLHWPIRRSAGFIQPRLSLYDTHYRLDQPTTAGRSRLQRSLLASSLDAGLFFERDAHVGSSRFMQTLEPRLFYLRVPYQDQRDIPRYDSDEPPFSMLSLFRENRFTGRDLVGDTNQLSLALTSRLIEPQSGRERLAVSLGQIRYFSERKVHLNPAAAPQHNDYSHLVTEADALLSERINLRARLLWDPYQERSAEEMLHLRYRDGITRRWQLGWRRERDFDEQVDVAYRWNHSPHWSSFARWNHSLHHERLVEAVIGGRYESCCWALSVGARRHWRSELGGENDNNVFFKLELKGLSSGGQRSTIEELTDTFGL